jgi:hypothetical protein
MDVVGTTDGFLGHVVPGSRRVKGNVLRLEEPSRWATSFLTSTCLERFTGERATTPLGAPRAQHRQ